MREVDQYLRWVDEAWESLPWTPRLPKHGERLPRKLKKRMAKAGRFWRWAGHVSCSAPGYQARIRGVAS
jgi:hypothetical protein